MPLAPRVAVVIPCRDDADFLEACLAALDAQDRPADRVIVIDNGSTDASAAVARAHGAEVFREDVVGIWPAAARGYDEAAADCDIIARVDADSRPHPDWICVGRVIPTPRRAGRSARPGDGITRPLNCITAGTRIGPRFSMRATDSPQASVGEVSRTSGSAQDRTILADFLGRNVESLKSLSWVLISPTVGDFSTALQSRLDLNMRTVS